MLAAELPRIIRSVLGRGLTVDQAEQLAHATVRATAPAGTTVLREGEQGDGLYMLTGGTVDIVKTAPGGGAQVIATLDAPTLLGEMSLLTDRPHSASVRAATDCEFWVLTRPQFLRLLESESLAAYKVVLTIAEVLARRLYRMDEKVVELSALHGSPPPVDEIVRFNEKLLSGWEP